MHMYVWRLSLFFLIDALSRPDLQSGLRILYWRQKEITEFSFGSRRKTEMKACRTHICD